MSHYARLVLDTKVVVSGILFPDSVPARALLKAQKATILSSEATRQELIGVMGRIQFDTYVQREIRQLLIEEYVKATVLVEIPSPIRACRDPRDDKFLEAAVHGRADLILTGDQDLLALDPFHGIAIVTPADYLARE